jgi:signal transduction histidine kinase
LKIVIYRILQESLNNVKKHSQANRVQIQLRQIHESLKLQIKDNGIGFDIQKAGESKDGMGIESMKDRAKLSNGTLEISSGKGTGTIIQVAWAI